MRDKILLSEAAKHVGKSVVTLRKHAQAKKFPTTRDEKGQYCVSLQDILGYYSELSAHQPIKPPSPGAHSELHPEILNAQVAALERVLSVTDDALDRERREKDRLAQQVQELTSQVVQLLAEMKAILQKQSSNGGLSKWFRG
jgi:hypothetical protein